MLYPVGQFWHIEDSLGEGNICFLSPGKAHTSPMALLKPVPLTTVAQVSPDPGRWNWPGKGGVTIWWAPLPPNHPFQAWSALFLYPIVTLIHPLPALFCTHPTSLLVPALPYLRQWASAVHHHTDFQFQRWIGPALWKSHFCDSGKAHYTGGMHIPLVSCMIRTDHYQNRINLCWYPD